jgi:hypothetical protein
MRRIAFVLSVIFAMALVPWSGQAGTTGLRADLDKDTINPVVAQNEPTRTLPNGAGYQDIPSADMHNWSADFNGATKKITLTMNVNGRVPRPGSDDAIDVPEGFVGVSYRLMFTSSTQLAEQVIGVNCGSYADEDTSPNAKTKQDLNYAKCTNSRMGPYKAPNFKFYIHFGIRQNFNSEGELENEGDVGWGVFDHYAQSLTFRSLKSDDPCTTGSGFALGGGVRQDTAVPCPWSARIIQNWAPGKDTVQLVIPYSPTWVLTDDLDDNAVANDENRHYDLVSTTATVNGIIANTWVDQVAGLPEPFCDPTGPTCGTNADATNCVDPQAQDPTKKVDVPCVQGAANDTVADYQRWANNPFDCTVNGRRAGECIQEIGGFVYMVDWAGAGSGAAVNNAYTLGLFSWPVPGYVPSPQCPYQYAVPFVNDGRVPDGVAVYADNDRRTGYTGLVMDYGVRIATDDSYHTANGRKGGYRNVVVPEGVPVSPMTIDNPVPTTYVANPLVNNASCTYTPAIGGRFVDANGINGISGA